MHIISFRGEESARFTRFALQILKYKDKTNNVTVIVEGREPLTSRYVKIKGTLNNAKLDGYRRHIEIIEEGSDMIYWAAGTNSTRSIATQKISFLLSEVEYIKLKYICQSEQLYIPGMLDSEELLGATWYFIDNAPQNINTENLYKLLELLDPNMNSDIIREAILDLRSFVYIVTVNKKLQELCEKKIVQILPIVLERDCRIALVELMGYLGSDNLASWLGDIVCNMEEDCHVRWAAAIAISRLSSNVVTNYLVQAYDCCTTNYEKISESSSVTDSEWVHAAILLGLARHATENNRDRLEECFYKQLDSGDQILRRYACLGLSKFNKLSDNTLQVLVECLGDTSIPISVQGYVALALISGLDNYSDNLKEKIENYLENYTIVADNTFIEPETIWGLEYLAELASLLEIHAVAAKFHLQLSDLFIDWRKSYYKAIYLYEKGESLVLQALREDALQSFYEAAYEIGKISDVEQESKAIVNFRKDIINVRIVLQNIFILWLQSVIQDEVLELKKRLGKEVISIYKRYRYSIDTSIDDKRFTERERKYITGTISILEVIMLIMQLDIECRNIEISMDNIFNLTEQIYESLREIKPYVAESRGTKHFVDIAEESVCQIYQPMQSMEILQGYYNNIRASRALVSEIKGLISKTTWPMPARACPLGGLGKGTISVHMEDMDGKGTESKPYIFNRNSQIVINIFVTIEEMAPGGLTCASVNCDIGNISSEKIDIHIVEGSTMVSFILPDVLSSQVITKIDFILRFESRDIFQESDRLSVYARRE